MDNRRRPRIVPEPERVVHRYHRRGEWASDPSRGALLWFAPGSYEEGVEIEPALAVPHEAVGQLIDFLNEHGYLRPRLDDRVRQDDVKVINRLMDLLDKALGPTEPETVVCQMPADYGAEERFRPVR